MKINLNKICLKKSFGQSLLVFVMLLVGVFTLSTSVKAETTVEKLTITNGYLNISTNINSVLICSIHTNSSGGSVTYNGYNLANLFSYSDWTVGALYQTFYLNSPTEGNNQISWSVPGSNFNDISCYLVTGVNTNNLITATSTSSYGAWVTPTTGYLNNSTAGSLLLDFVLVGGAYSNGVLSSSDSTLAGNAGDYIGFYVSTGLIYKTSSGGNESLSANLNNTGGQGSRHLIFQLNTQFTLPPCESYNYSDWGFCGENGRQFRTILSSNPTSCNYTDVNSAAPVLGQDCTYVAPVYPDTSLPFTIVSPFTFSYESTAKVDYTYDTSVFTPYDYIEVRRLSSDWATSTFISTSSPVANDLLHNGNSFFILPGDQEIRGRHNYEVIGYFAPYYLPGVGDMPATSSIPVVFSVYWQKTQIPTAQDIIDYEHTVSTELAHGVLYESSCTNEEWATPDPQVDFGFGVWTFPALNFTRLQCAVKLATLELGTEVIDKVTGYFTKIGNMLKNVFPFNIYTNLNESWENSAYTDVLPELSFLSPVNGNLSVQVPNGTIGSSTSFVVWGSGIFTSPDTLGSNNSTKINQLFVAIRTIIKWALWGLFGFWVVRNGQAFVKKLTGGE